MSQSNQLLLVAFETEQALIADEMLQEYWDAPEHHCDCDMCSGRYDDYDSYDEYYDGNTYVEFFDESEFDRIQDQLEGIR